MSSIAERYCRSNLRHHIYCIFPPLFIIAALGMFSLPGLLWSPAVTLIWVIYGIITGGWWNDAGSILFAGGPSTLACNLIGILHLPAFVDYSGPPPGSSGDSAEWFSESDRKPNI